MVDPKINYVVACWAGPRRFMHPIYAADRAAFLRLHVRQLEHLRHNLAAITVVVNDHPEEALSSFADSLDRTAIRGAPVRVIKRPNVGMSYGAWADAFERDQESFSHYLWIEDDYVVVQDDFDVKLVAMMEVSDCDYLCGFAADFGSGRHAAISNGLVRSKILSRVRRAFGRLPHAEAATDYLDNYRDGQVGLSSAILAVGGTLGDFTEFGWAAPWSDMGRVMSFGDPGGAHLIVPIEVLCPVADTPDVVLASGNPDSLPAPCESSTSNVPSTD